MKQYILDAVANHKTVFIYFKDNFDPKEAFMINSAKSCEGNCLIVGTGIIEYCVNLDQVLSVECR